MHCCPLSFVFFLKWTSPLSLPNFKRNQIEFPLNPRDPCESTRLADFALPEGQTHPSAVSILLFFLSFFYFACELHLVRLSKDGGGFCPISDTFLFRIYYVF